MNDCIHACKQVSLHSKNKHDDKVVKGVEKMIRNIKKSNENKYELKRLQNIVKLVKSKKYKKEMKINHFENCVYRYCNKNCKRTFYDKSIYPDDSNINLVYGSYNRQIGSKNIKTLKKLGLLSACTSPVGLDDDNIIVFHNKSTNKLKKENFLKSLKN